MGWWESLKARLRTEAADLGQAKNEAEARIDADLSRREAQLDETPEQAMERIQREMGDNESSFDSIRDRIDQAATRGTARHELDPPDPAGPVEPDVDPAFLDRPASQPDAEQP